VGWSFPRATRITLAAISIACSAKTLANPPEDASHASSLSKSTQNLLQEESPLAFTQLRPALLSLSGEYQALQHGRIGIAFKSTQAEAVDSVYDPVIDVCVINTGSREAVSILYEQLTLATHWGHEKVSTFIAAHEIQHCITSSHIAKAIDELTRREDLPYAVELAAQALYPDSGHTGILAHFDVKENENAQTNNLYNEAVSDIFAMLIIRQRFGLSDDDVAGIFWWRSRASDPSHDTSPWIKEFRENRREEVSLGGAGTFNSASELSMQLAAGYRSRLSLVGSGKTK
jgi:hypothetical protein